MSLLDRSMQPEQELRWRAWQEKSRISDQLAQRRMKILFSAVAAILIIAILYWSFRRKTTPNGTQPIVAVHGGRTPSANCSNCWLRVTGPYPLIASAKLASKSCRRESTWTAIHV